jgi:poly-gamma-glutamate capsule biosynthesis protein CapA/YwtB (metallophosphatase superfamily)
MPGAPATTLTRPDERDCEELTREIGELRKKVDVLVVYFHWGVSGQQEICEYQQSLGRLAIDAGADLVAGSHPHVVQAVELYKVKPVFYSLGNFIFGSDFKPARGYRNGLVAIAEIEKRRVVRICVQPSAINAGEQPALLRAAQPEAAAMIDNLQRSSAAFNTGLSRHRDRWTVTAA